MTHITSQIFHLGLYRLCLQETQLICWWTAWLAKKQNCGIPSATLGSFQGILIIVIIICHSSSVNLFLEVSCIFYILLISNLPYKIIFDREQWKSYVAPYHPIFMDGWSPEYPIPVSVDHMTNASVAGVSESKKSRDEIKIPNIEVSEYLMYWNNSYMYLFMHIVILLMYISCITGRVTRRSISSSWSRTWSWRWQ